MADKYEEIIGDGPTLRMLERIQQNRALIHVRIQDRAKSWSSTIVTVDIEGRSWKFDELPTAEGHRLLIKERRCEIETRLSGVIIKFQAEIISSGADRKGLVYYESRPPRSMRVYQRRSDFRVPIGANQRATVSFIIPGMLPMRGHIRDISLGGIGIELGAWTQVLDYGLHIPNCMITLPDNKLISCELRICFARRSNIGMSIGARFEKISKDDQKQISKFVNFLDRERAKRKHLE
ncbi:flagellar brake protein [Gammaproteobacteria bacterium]